MDFDRLPNEILLPILQRLPFTERVRIACVNRRFKDVSEMAISQTKALCLTAPIFRNANAKSMRKLIQLCAPNLKELICDVPHTTQDQYRSMMLDRLEIFTKFSHPRLEVLKIDTINLIINVDPFRKLLASLPNLRTMEWSYALAEKFPEVVCKNLQCVTIQICVDKFVASLANCCPNVKHFVLTNDFSNGQEHHLNEAFTKWPALETIELELSLDATKLEKIDNLWNQASLRTLLLGDECLATDQLLEKISMAFPKLERLKIKLGYTVSNSGFAVLKNLQHLRQITLTERRSDETRLFITEMISFECLETIEIIGEDLSVATVSTIAHRCPNLRKLQIPGISYVNTPKKARSFVRSLYGFIQEKLIISIACERVWVWDCPQVRSAIAQINKSKNGRQISISVGDRKRNLVHGSCSGASEWDTDPDCLYFKRSVKPATTPIKRAKKSNKGIGRRLIGAIRDLARKMSKLFK